MNIYHTNIYIYIYIYIYIRRTIPSMHLISAVCSGLKNLLNKRDDVELEIKNYYFSLSNYYELNLFISFLN